MKSSLFTIPHKSSEINFACDSQGNGPVKNNLFARGTGFAATCKISGKIVAITYEFAGMKFKGHHQTGLDYISQVEKVIHRTVVQFPNSDSGTVAVVPFICLHCFTGGGINTEFGQDQ